MARWTKKILVGQGVYFSVTGIWPFLHVDSFLWLTGPKAEVWLVRTVGALVLVIGVVILSAVSRRRMTFEIFLLAGGCAAGLFFIDVFYGVTGRISPVYLLDAVLEGIFAWNAAAAIARGSDEITGR